MRALACMVLVALLPGTISAGAQPVGTEGAAPPRAEERNDDRITLKSGRVLRGVKIIQTTPFKLVLEVIPAVEPLEIPARQVVSVAYGERPPEEPDKTEQETTDEGDTSQVLQAVKVSPDLLKKLSAPLTEKSVNFMRQDLLNALRSAGILFGVPVSFGPRLENLPTEERLVSVSLSEGTSFEGFIRDTLAPQLPWLKVEYRFDAVHFDRT